MKRYIIININTKIRSFKTPLFEFPSQAINYIKKKMNNSKLLTIKEVSICKGVISTGERCKNIAMFNGFCIMHYNQSII